VIYRLADHGGGCLDLPVEQIMTSPAVTVEPATTVDEALSLMTRRRFRHFPVVEDGTLIAFISIGDLVKHKMDEVQHEANALRDYIQAV
jgi:CBS domain-containing protein